MKRSLSLQGLLWSKKAVAEEEEKDNRKTSFATLSTFGVS